MSARILRCVAAMLAIAVSGLEAGAQADPVSSVSGRVVLAAPGEELRPVPGTWVALNRVGSDSAGVVDSLRTAGDGSYRFTYRRSGDPDAIYFTDATYAGVAYFTDPLRGLNVSGEDADIVVFDTMSAPSGGTSLLRVRGRHLVVGPEGSDGRRPIVEVFELTNDTSFTVVPRSDTEPVWSTPLLPGARGGAVGGGDIVENVVRFGDGRAELYAPIAPGLRQLSINYTVPGSSFPLKLELPHGPEVLEVLIAGTSGSASGAGLHAEEPVGIEDQPYLRFLSQRAAAGDEVVITLAGGSLERLAVPVAVAMTAVILAGALVYARRRTYPSGTTDSSGRGPRKPV